MPLVSTSHTQTLPTSRARRLTTGATIVATLACARGDRGSAADTRTDQGPPLPSSRAAVRTAAAPDDPCAWISASAVAEVVGPLDGAPARVRSAEQPRPDVGGAACLYRLAAQPRAGTGEVVVQVMLDGAAQFETVGGAVGRRLAREAAVGPPGGGTAALSPVRDTASGWDYEGGLPLTYVGRLGHVGVIVAARTLELPRQKLAALAARVRDRVPDRPFAAPANADLAAVKAAAGDTEPEPPPAGPDPCGLLTREEAEAVLGKLTVAPYRSNSATALADPSGQGCTYFTGRHRALVLEPAWRGGRTRFGMAKSIGAAVSSGLGPDGGTTAGGGSWEDALSSAMTGNLYFLKGDRMLQMVYLTSSTDVAGAGRLARTAVARL